MSMINPWENEISQQEFFKKAAKAIYENKSKFDELKNSNQKLQFVKSLKDLIGCGLKDAKDAADLYWVGKLPHYIKEERREKLERLAKLPLVDELIVKFRKLDDAKLHDLLMELNVDELFSIDEKIENKNE